MNYRKWTSSDLDFIKNNCSIMKDNELAQQLSVITGDNITVAMIRNQRRKAGLSKNRGRKPQKLISNSNSVSSENN